MRPRTIMAAVLVACLVLAAAPAAQADIVWAGDGFVELDAAGLPDGDLLLWTNTGSLNGVFIYESADGVLPLVETIDSAQAVTFTGSNLFTGPNAPAGLTGLDPTRSIEVWAYNPFIAGEETLVAWGKRNGPTGTNMSFNYGNHGAFGSVGHWGSPDLGWGAISAPQAGEWHHLVYTYDGTTTSVYADGELMDSEILGAGVINTYADTPIRIGSQTEADGVTATGGLRASLSIGRVRIHDGVLSLDDIVNNYDEERPEFPLPEPPEPAVPEPLETPPIHRWSFEEDGAAGTELVDSIGSAHGTIVDLGLNDGTVGGGQVTLAGGAKADSDYVEFPSAILAGMGDVTFETWATQHSVQNWSRVFDFGIDTTNNILMAWTQGTNLNADRAGIKLANNETSIDNTMAPYTIDEEFHIVMTLDGDATSSGDTVISLYKDGELMGEFATPHSVLDVNDTNNWLGRSQYGDNTANASWDEFRIYDYALSANKVLGNFEAGADVINLGTASQLTWDEAGAGVWSDLRWLDGEGAAADFIPDDSIDVTIKTDAVLVDADATANIVTVESGVLHVASGATLATTAAIVAAGATLEANDATIIGDVEVSGVLSNGGDASTSTLDGNLTLADGSTLVLGATGTGVGSVVVAGDATIGDSSLVIQFGGGEANQFKAGTYTLIDNQGENGLLGTFGAVTDLGDYATAGEAEDGLLYDPAGVTLVLEKDLHGGDADLSTATDLSDFNIWNANKFISGTDWTTGDFNGDGVTDLSDFNIWNANKFTTATGGAAPAPTEVPEPGSLALLFFGLLAMAVRLCRPMLRMAVGDV